MTTTMNRRHSFDSSGLLQAAINGDDAGVLEALKAGADVNAVDAHGRTALTNAITGESWQTIHASDASFMSESRLNILKALVGHPDISLYTLNAPQECMSSVCPLGMCAWLNLPTAVEVLLGCSSGRMSVDGIDSLGATPLMYAARDGNLAVVKHLLNHGARPDYRDMNYRTPIQYALPHSDILCMFEACIREIRCQAKRSRNTSTPTTPTDDTHTQSMTRFRLLDLPPASLFPFFTGRDITHATDQLIRAIVSTDLKYINSLLCPPPPSPPRNISSNAFAVLINTPDGDGWSPIHHCVAIERPSMEVLDALYFAGADVSLFTSSEYYTPLHCLARREHPSMHSLYLFTTHLVQDLHAPLNAKDRNDDTCIHIAAEQGECIDVLMAFLDCDKTCAVRDSRNLRGLTALEVAKPEFRAAFGTEHSIPRPRSSVSMRTIRPSMSFTTLSPLYEPSASISSTHGCPLPFVSPIDFDVISSSKSLVNNLGTISTDLWHNATSASLDAIQDMLDESTLLSHSILSHFRTQVDEARNELGSARATFSRVDEFWKVVSHAVEARLKNDQAADEGLLFKLTHARRSTLDSADSQATAVSSSPVAHSPKLTPHRRGSIQELETYVTVAQYKDASIATEPSSVDAVAPHAPINDLRPGLWPEWLGSLVGSPESTTQPSHFGNLDHSGHHIFGRPRTGSRPSTPRKDALRNMLVGRKKEEFGQDSDDERRSGLDVMAKNGAASGSWRFKTWLKKKIVADHRPLKLEVVVDLDEAKCAVGREVKTADDYHVPQTPAKMLDAEGNVVALDPSLRAHLIALIAAGRDLSSIEECMTAAEQFIATAYRSISRAERISQRALRAREQAIQDLRSRCIPGLAAPESERFSFLHTVDPPRHYDHSGYPSSPPSSAISTAYSSQSSCVSLASSTDADDEDTRALRGLLLRKIETRLNGSFDEIDKITMWLRVVREVVRGVKNRAIL